MSESLRSNRVQACDGERITLQCPKNTHIQVRMKRDEDKE